MNRVMAVIAVLSVALLAANSVKAEPASDQAALPILISHIQAGATGDHTREMVAVYNNGSEHVDITGWCITNKSTTFDTQTSAIIKPLGCFISEMVNERMILPGYSYAVLASESFMIAHPVTDTITYDAVLEKTASVTAGSDTITLFDATPTPIDGVTWTTSLEAGKLLRRKAADSFHLIDTSTLSDFEKISGPVIPVSGVEYVRTVQDVCGNLENVQDTLPVGYGYDEAGNCELLSLDMCLNIDAIQLEVPAGLTQADGSGCYADMCPNLEGLQLSVPDGYLLQQNTCIALESRVLHLNEILPNAAGSDTGQEFIELYNPHDEPVHLKGYVLLIGKSLEHEYVLGIGDQVIPAGGYHVLTDDEIGFSLLNTSSKIQLRAPAGNIVSETEYMEPRDDQSWSWIAGQWQFTDQLTQNSENKPMAKIFEEVEGVTTVLAPCPAGKYRHPITNRCRNIEADTVMLVACDADEYRNPETNRCRKVATLAATLTPCNVGYERNPETNRCRKTESAQKELAACQSGYERNPATNRCRKSTALAAISTPASAVEASSSGSVLTNALIITAGLGAVSYGLYEWRSEFVRGARRLIQMVSGK
jgi:hypothetical protein